MPEQHEEGKISWNKEEGLGNWVAVHMGPHKKKTVFILPGVVNL